MKRKFVELINGLHLKGKGLTPEIAGELYDGLTDSGHGPAFAAVCNEAWTAAAAETGRAGTAGGTGA